MRWSGPNHDHEPAHFHAICGGDEAIVRVHPFRILRGSLPLRALVREWTVRHRAELELDWELARTPAFIAPDRSHGVVWSPRNMIHRVVGFIGAGPHSLYLRFQDGRSRRENRLPLLEGSRPSSASNRRTEPTGRNLTSGLLNRCDRSEPRCAIFFKGCN
ncbi:MAG: DUF4160 domain-containing protein [Acidobacteria bacterium]|nr:DUF4160 domain-containing protein [Acidobacteriota bacterium]